MSSGDNKTRTMSGSLLMSESLYPMHGTAELSNSFDSNLIRSSVFLRSLLVLGMVLSVSSMSIHLKS